MNRPYFPLVVVAFLTLSVRHGPTTVDREEA
jgi:hypothetical protein